MEPNKEITMEDVLGPGKELSDEQWAQSEAEEKQWQAELEQEKRAESLLTLVVNGGTAREKEIDINRDVTPFWETLTSGIVAADNASGDYPLPDALTDEFLYEVGQHLCERIDNPGEGDSPHWLLRELETTIEVINTIEEYSRERLSLRYIADWGEREYQFKQKLKALGLE